MSAQRDTSLSPDIWRVDHRGPACPDCGHGCEFAEWVHDDEPRAVWRCTFCYAEIQTSGEIVRVLPGIKVGEEPK